MASKSRKRAQSPTVTKAPVAKIAELEARLAELARAKEKSAFEKILIGEFSVTQKLVAALLMVTTVAALFGYLRPVVETGAMPWPSRAEVTALAKATDEKLLPVKEGLDATLEIAKSALAGVRVSEQESRASRIQRMLSQIVQIEQMITMDPNNTTLKQLLEQMKESVTVLRTEQAQAAQVARPPPTK